MGPTIPDEAKGQVCPVCGGRGKVSSDFYDQVPWVALAEMGREREQAHRVLDMWGAPKTAYNYLAKAPTDDVLTLGGRIQCLLNPDNEEGFPNWRANASQAESHVRRLEEENARLRDLIGQIVDAAGPPRIVGRVELDPLLIAVAADVLRGGHPSSTTGHYLPLYQVQQVREAVETVLVYFRQEEYERTINAENARRGGTLGPFAPPDWQAKERTKARLRDVLSLLGGGKE